MGMTVATNSQRKLLFPLPHHLINKVKADYPDISLCCWTDFSVKPSHLTNYTDFRSQATSGDLSSNSFLYRPKIWSFFSYVTIKIPVGSKFQVYDKCFLKVKVWELAYHFGLLLLTTFFPLNLPTSLWNLLILNSVCCIWWNILKVLCLSFPGRKEGNHKSPFMCFMPMTQKPKELGHFLTTLNGIMEKHVTFSTRLCKQDM